MVDTNRYSYTDDCHGVTGKSGNEQQHESSVSTYIFRASYSGNSLCGSRGIPFSTKKTK